MVRDIEINNTILLLDNYASDSHKLHTSLKKAGKENIVVVIDSDGFLPDDVISVYEYFLGDFKCDDIVPGRPRYFNQINVPDYWEISGNNNFGKISNLNKERARIFYAEPKHKRFVKVVDWYDERGIVRSSDHYNKYGILYARTIFNAKGKRVNKAYFSVSGKEIIVENYVTKNIILNDGNITKIFKTKTDFVTYFLKKAGLHESRLFFNTLSTSFLVSQNLSAGDSEDVLFWQESIGDEIPGNMRFILEGKSARKTKIIVQKRQAYNKLLELGVSENMIKKLGYIYQFEKENYNKPKALICTNSDRIAECCYLVEALPEMHFHIVALTEMSAKLMDMDKYSNVSLYPGVKMTILDELFKECDFYFDINYESEIVSAVQRAFLHNQLIFAFKETMHNSEYISEEHIYEIKSVDNMISCLKEIISNKDLLKEHLSKQHDAAFSESVEAYSQI